MKKLLFLCALLLLICISCAGAEKAKEITKECTFRFSGAEGRIAHIHDGDYETYMESPRKEKHRLYITTGKTPAAGVYVEFGIRRLPFTVEVKKGDKWVKIASSEGRFAQEYVSFAPVTGELRLNIGGAGSNKIIRIYEITVLGKGDIDTNKIHVWQPTVKKADLLLSVTHPDDELLWFGGLIPYYTIEKKLNVLVSYLAVFNSCRELELLNGLWHCGVRNYPEIAYLEDFSASTKKEVYAKWGSSAAEEYLVEIIRKYRPEVVVTHDFNGEYGHGQHLVCAESTEDAVSYAANAKKYKDSAKKYGTWQTKKFYVHLGKGTTVMDWHQPVSGKNGKTGFQIASEAYQMHRSQLKDGNIYVMADRGTKYDSFLFTLISTRVGNDKKGGDLFENIPAKDLSNYK